MYDDCCQLPNPSFINRFSRCWERLWNHDINAGESVHNPIRDNSTTDVATVLPFWGSRHMLNREHLSVRTANGGRSSQRLLLPRNFLSMRVGETAGIEVRHLILDEIVENSADSRSLNQDLLLGRDIIFKHFKLCAEKLVGQRPIVTLTPRGEITPPSSPSAAEAVRDRLKRAFTSVMGVNR